jgi:hypothetical protein
VLGLSQGSPSQSEIISMALKTALPDEAARTLSNIADQLAALRDRQTEIGALQQQLATDRATADKRKAELDARAQDLDGRDAALSARAARIQAVADQFEQRLAAHAATLGSTS